MNNWNPNPVRFDPENMDWGYWDETWSYWTGGYQTEAEANKALQEYCEHYL